MWTKATDELRLQASAYAFRFACEDCAHFDERGDSCSLGYPPAPKRDSVEARALRFCKTFELGAGDA